MKDTEREFIRHTVNVPLEVKVVPDAPALAEQSYNVSHGGLAFTFEYCLEIGQIIELRISTVEPPFDAQARVVWCKPEGTKYLVGAQFMHANDAFESRMVQQVCAIEQYRQEVAENEGRTLTSQEAAAEWIQKFARKFPTDGAE